MTKIVFEPAIPALVHAALLPQAELLIAVGDPVVASISPSDIEREGVARPGETELIGCSFPLFKRQTDDGWEIYVGPAGRWLLDSFAQQYP